MVAAGFNATGGVAHVRDRLGAIHTANQDEVARRHAGEHVAAEFVAHLVVPPDGIDKQRGVVAVVCLRDKQ